jgi:hypothetical protein
MVRIPFISVVFFFEEEYLFFTMALVHEGERKKTYSNILWYGLRDFKKRNKITLEGLIVLQSVNN